MAELRYNPILKDWTMVASHRQSRPQMPADWCPFCPGSGKVPGGGFSVLRYPNDFPALSVNPPEPDDVETALFKVRPSYGRCEVILYSDRHTASLCELPDEHVHALSRLWQEVFNDLSSDEKIKYVFIFENRGEEVGVTMPHPHGQVYGYPYIPKRMEQEAESAREHYVETGKNLFAELLAEEKRDGRRIIFENQHFTVYVPFFSPVTYGIWVSANREAPHLGAMSDAELKALGETVRDCSGMYDSLFDKAFPYMMCMHNAPVNSGDFDQYWQFHIEFIPPMRGPDKQQFFASSESGAGAFCNPNRPEEKAAELREAYGRYIQRREK